MPTAKQLANLIPVTKRTPSEQRRISSLGGKAGLGKTRYNITTCKSCKLKMCPLKEKGTIEKWRCKIPDQKRLILEAHLEPHKLFAAGQGLLWDLITTAKNHKEKKAAHDALKDFKNTFAPERQKIQHDIMQNIQIEFIEPQANRVIDITQEKDEQKSIQDKDTAND